MGYSKKLYSTQNIITIISVKAKKKIVQYSYKNCNSDYDLDWKISFSKLYGKPSTKVVFSPVFKRYHSTLEVELFLKVILRFFNSLRSWKYLTIWICKTNFSRKKIAQITISLAIWRKNVFVSCTVFTFCTYLSFP